MRAFMYISRATNKGAAPWMPHDYKSILDASRENNSKRDITGFLGYQDGYFLQYIEGPKRGVEKALVQILKDERHQDAHALMNTIIEKRNFDNWRVPLGSRLMKDGAYQSFIRRHQPYFSGQSQEHVQVLKAFKAYTALNRSGKLHDVAFANAQATRKPSEFQNNRI